MKILLRILATAATLIVLSQIEGSGIVVDGWYTAIIVAIFWGIISITIKPVLNLLALPINILTFGLFSFIINALLFWLLSLLAGFHVSGFLAALIGSIVLSLVSFVLHKL